ncbi:uncharacterized protein RAG0_01213 [Rhynchosporium agropyri]|uniref:Uncharacterized protein n=1 Tax=Rhynchosporium agropyri TaxID=914238 RepID=A0A1E1JW78_9HELO|nr:uncharacterized protein RAG0_01213 [Rhynchosporium agropyri]
MPGGGKAPATQIDNTIQRSLKKSHHGATSAVAQRTVRQESLVRSSTSYPHLDRVRLTSTFGRVSLNANHGPPICVGSADLCPRSPLGAPATTNCRVHFSILLRATARGLSKSKHSKLTLITNPDITSNIPLEKATVKTICTQESQDRHAISACMPSRRRIRRLRSPRSVPATRHPSAKPFAVIKPIKAHKCQRIGKLVLLSLHEERLLEHSFILQGQERSDPFGFLTQYLRDQMKSRP